MRSYGHNIVIQLSKTKPTLKADTLIMCLRFSGVYYEG
jgi:hypothetical protein